MRRRLVRSALPLRVRTLHLTLEGLFPPAPAERHLLACLRTTGHPLLAAEAAARR